MFSKHSGATGAEVAMSALPLPVELFELQPSPISLAFQLFWSQRG